MKEDPECSLPQATVAARKWSPRLPDCPLRGQRQKIIWVPVSVAEAQPHTQSFVLLFRSGDRPTGDGLCYAVYEYELAGFIRSVKTAISS